MLPRILSRRLKVCFTVGRLGRERFIPRWRARFRFLIKFKTRLCFRRNRPFRVLLLIRSCRWGRTGVGRGGGRCRRLSSKPRVPRFQPRRWGRLIKVKFLSLSIPGPGRGYGLMLRGELVICRPRPIRRLLMTRVLFRSGLRSVNRLMLFVKILVKLPSRR